MSHVTLTPPRDKQCDYNKSRASILSEAEDHAVQEKEQKQLLWTLVTKISEHESSLH